mmetsp:Transcript_32757/g.87862  ORF Transcript_32757/g.87862 Transcript_32757/m.87862 type:complete len:253 (-) Transcript_32757:709-1467(-)
MNQENDLKRVCPSQTRRHVPFSSTVIRSMGGLKNSTAWKSPAAICSLRCLRAATDSLGPCALPLALAAAFLAAGKSLSRMVLVAFAEAESWVRFPSSGATHDFHLLASLVGTTSSSISGSSMIGCSAEVSSPERIFRLFENANSHWFASMPSVTFIMSAMISASSWHSRPSLPSSAFAFKPYSSTSRFTVFCGRWAKARWACQASILESSAELRLMTQPMGFSSFAPSWDVINLRGLTIVVFTMFHSFKSST